MAVRVRRLVWLKQEVNDGFWGWNQIFYSVCKERRAVGDVKQDLIRTGLFVRWCDLVDILLCKTTKLLDWRRSPDHGYCSLNDDLKAALCSQIFWKENTKPWVLYNITFSVRRSSDHCTVIWVLKQSSRLTRGEFLSHFISFLIVSDDPEALNTESVSADSGGSPPLRTHHVGFHSDQQPAHRHQCAVQAHRGFYEASLLRKQKRLQLCDSVSMY